MTMPRTYAAKRLLEHGPLTTPEFVEITGWQQRQAERVLQQLLDTEVVSFKKVWNQHRTTRSRTKTRLYALESSSNASGCASSMQTTQTAATANTGSNLHG